MSHTLPSGVRDLLPDAAARLAELTARLQTTFAAHGFRRVVTPTLERYEVIERGLTGPAREAVVRFVEPGTGELVALRPDITPQLARMFAARAAALPSPARLSYDGPVLRAREARAGRPREVHQAGIELLGAGGAAADAETVALLAHALEAAGLSFGPGKARLDLGHARFATAVLDACGLAADERASAEGALARKDGLALEELAAASREAPSSAQQQARAQLPRLTELYGDTGLHRARAVASAVPAARGPLAEVESLLPLLTAAGAPEPQLDLGELRGLGYYTGITFAAYAAGAGAPVAAGGRYDGLLGRFGRPGPAVGFAVDLEYLAAALPPPSAPVPADPGAWGAKLLLVPGRLPPTALLDTARQLRARGLRVGLLTELRPLERLLTYARDTGHDGVMVPADDAPHAFELHPVTGGAPRRVRLEDL